MQVRPPCPNCGVDMSDESHPKKGWCRECLLPYQNRSSVVIRLEPGVCYVGGIRCGEAGTLYACGYRCEKHAPKRG